MPSQTKAIRPNSPSARDIANHLHPFTNLTQHEREGPLIIERGEGIHVVDTQGRRYIEGMSGLWCTSLGFSEPRLAAAAFRQMQKLPFNHTFRGRSHDVTIDLAERLVALAPVPMSKAFFASSGSEANDTAIKIVWYYNNARKRPHKRKIIARRQGYHGTTVITAAMTGIADFHRSFGLPISDILHVDCPHYYRFGKLGESEEEYASRLAENLEKAIKGAGPETVAAFIAEPVMGVGGVLVPPRTYFEKCQAVLRKYDVLLIADEIICGFGRTGNWWGSQTFGIHPDILTAAKGLSSGYVPISAVLINEPIYRAISGESDSIGVFGHGHTYSGHPVCAAVALETLKIYEERDIVGHVRTVSKRFQNGLQRHADSSIVGEVRGVGLMAAVQLVADKGSKAPFPADLKAATQLAARAFGHGLIVRAIGDSVVMAPPLVITEPEIDDLLDRFGKALNEAEELLVPSRSDRPS